MPLCFTGDNLLMIRRGDFCFLVIGTKVGVNKGTLVFKSFWTRYRLQFFFPKLYMKDADDKAMISRHGACLFKIHVTGSKRGGQGVGLSPPAPYLPLPPPPPLWSGARSSAKFSSLPLPPFFPPLSLLPSPLLPPPAPLLHLPLTLSAPHQRSRTALILFL